MPGHERTVTLPPDLADYVEARVSSGAYASAEEVLRAGLEALQERDETLDDWIIREVLPVHDRMLQDPSREIPLETVTARLRARWNEGRASGPAQAVDIEALIAEERRRHAGGG